MSSMNRSDSTFSLSITLRLTLLFLVSTLLILGSVSLFMLRNMEADLEYEDNDFLSERITSIQTLLTRHAGNLQNIREQVLINNTGKHTRYLVRIQDATGTILLESPDMTGIKPAVFPEPVTNLKNRPKGSRYQSPDGHYYLMNAVWASGQDTPYSHLIQVALDISEEKQLMARYRVRMSLAVAAGLCLATALGILVSRKGLRPVQSLAAQVKAITVTDLHQRVGSTSWPQELRPLAEALDTMLGQLESSFSRLTGFTANLAHELRTPINNLRVEAEVALSRARTADDYRQTIESFSEEFERIARMISDILFLARPGTELVRQQVDLRAELETLIEYYRTLAEERQIVLQLNGHGAANVDPPLFQRAVGNLLANALYYTQPGGTVSVTIAPDENGGTVVTTKDTGNGISEQELPLVFERFYRGSQARKSRPEGSGLGLAIVRSIVELHNGTITLSSHPGKGTTASINLPRR